MVTILPPTYQTVTPKPLLHGLCHCEVATVCQGGLDKFVLYPQILKAIIKSCVGHVMESFCNETFDFQAMGRIFVGLCQVIVIIITHVCNVLVHSNKVHYSLPRVCRLGRGVASMSSTGWRRGCCLLYLIRSR